MTTPDLREDHVSQLPALIWLQKLGYTYLSPTEALAERGGKSSAMLLEAVLRAQLARLNQIQHRGRSYDFTEANLGAAVQALRELPWQQGYMQATQQAYEFLLSARAWSKTSKATAKATHCTTLIGSNPSATSFT